MDNQLLTGVVLIAAGLALGLLAYAIVISRRERGSGQEADALTSVEPAPAPPLAAPEPPPPSPVARAAPPTPALAPPAPAIPVAPPAPRPAASSGRANVQVATLERNEVTGELIVRVGDKEYQSAKELRASSDWTRIQYASGDLQRWMTDVEAAHRPRGAPREVATPPARTMIEQINGILARKIAETGVGKQGVRLVDSAGVVQVFLGVERYEMDKVPDEGVRKLIREAVSEWEARP
ncbi:MAG: hypothetical protein WD040_06685 [Anaerolineales bacterium]